MPKNKLHAVIRYAQDIVKGKIKLCHGCEKIKTVDMFHKCLRENDGLQSQCKICKSETGKQWYKANTEKILAVNKAYRDANPEKTKERHRNWKKNNQDKIKAYEKANPEKVKAWKVKYINNNRDKHMEAVRKYQKENPDKICDIAKRRRKYIADVTIEKFSSLEIFDRDGWICQICLKPVDKTLKYPNPMSKSLDHVIPIAASGSHERKNVQLAHLVCNKRDNSRGIKRRWAHG